MYHHIVTLTSQSEAADAALILEAIVAARNRSVGAIKEQFGLDEDAYQIFMELAMPLLRLDAENSALRSRLSAAMSGSLIGRPYPSRLSGQSAAAEPEEAEDGTEQDESAEPGQNLIGHFSAQQPPSKRAAIKRMGGALLSALLQTDFTGTEGKP